MANFHLHLKVPHVQYWIWIILTTVVQRMKHWIFAAVDKMTDRYSKLLLQLCPSSVAVKLLHFLTVLFSVFLFSLPSLLPIYPPFLFDILPILFSLILPSTITQPTIVTLTPPLPNSTPPFSPGSQMEGVPSPKPSGSGEDPGGPHWYPGTPK